MCIIDNLGEINNIIYILIQLYIIKITLNVLLHQLFDIIYINYFQ